MKFPVYNALYYKNVVDAAFQRFFLEFNSDFVKSDDGEFVFSGRFSSKSLEKKLGLYIKDELKKYVGKYSDSNPEFFIVIGSCVPGENFILDKIGDGESQKHMKTLVEIIPDIRYFLKEQDISLDLRLFNSIFEEIFLDYMSGRKTLGKHVIFLRHRNLDCYFTYKILKKRYGSMLVNAHKKFNIGDDKCIISINEKIDNLCRKKTEILNGDDISSMREEVYRFIDEKIMEI